MTSEKDIRDVLRSVLDPEMPINIVDLGLIEGVALEAVEFGGESGTRLRARIDVLPTFVGCPALDMIRSEIRDRVGDLPDVADVEVRFLNDPAWTVDRISPAGRETLRGFGVTVPERGGGCAAASAPRPVALTVSAAPQAVACPFCESSDTVQESRFGPTRCKMIYYCNACRNSFEHLKDI